MKKWDRWEGSLIEGGALLVEKRFVSGCPYLRVVMPDGEVQEVFGAGEVDECLVYLSRFTAVLPGLEVKV